MELSGEKLKEIRTALAKAFPPATRRLRLVVADSDTGLDFDNYDGTYDNKIHDLLKDAVGGYQLTRLLKAAVDAAPNNPELKEFAEFVRDYFGTLSRMLSASDGTKLGEVERKLFEKVRFEDVREWLNTLDQLTRVVCRIESPTGYGTGFLVGSDVILTNDHVASGPDGRSGFWGRPDRAREVTIRFDYVQTAEGIAEGKRYRLAKDYGVLRSPVDQLDFALLRLDSREGRPGDQITNGRPRGFVIPVNHRFEDSEPLLILQHPQAKPMKLAFGSVTQRKQWEPNRITYTVNTEPGSSGSPCLTQKLNVGALHHYGLERQNRGVLMSALLAFWNEAENRDRLREAGLGHLIEEAIEERRPPPIDPLPFAGEPTVGQSRFARPLIGTAALVAGIALYAVYSGTLGPGPSQPPNPTGPGPSPPPNPTGPGPSQPRKVTPEPPEQKTSSVPEPNKKDGRTLWVADEPYKTKFIKQADGTWLSSDDGGRPRQVWRVTDVTPSKIVLESHTEGGPVISGSLTATTHEYQTATTDPTPIPGRFR